jgi:hypothetical protein
MFTLLTLIQTGPPRTCILYISDLVIILRKEKN